jgi:hypothetical protein
MKTLVKNVLASAVLVGAASGANALPIYLDFGVDGDFVDADSRTDIFERFTLASFSPLSTYFDENSNGVVDSGEFVADTGSTTVVSLNPLAFGDSLEGFNSAWGINVSWNLFGVANVVGPNVGAAILGGTVTFSMNPGSAPAYNAFKGTPLFTINVTGAAPDGLQLDLFGELSTAQTGWLYDAGDTDLGALVGVVTVPVLGTTEFSGLVNPTGPVAPSAAAVAVYEAVNGAGSAAGLQALTRTTNLNSANVEFVPVPATLGLLGLGLLGLRRQLRKRAA